MQRTIYSNNSDELSRRLQEAANERIMTEDKRLRDLGSTIEKSLVLDVLGGRGCEVKKKRVPGPRLRGILPVTRQYRHKRDMVNDIKSYAQEYEICRLRCARKDSKLVALQTEAKNASAKATMAKVKVKSLVTLIRKMISHSIHMRECSNSTSTSKHEEYNGSGHSDLVEEGLDRISSILPEYTRAIEDIGKLAVQARNEKEYNVMNVADYNKILCRLENIGGRAEDNLKI